MTGMGYPVKVRVGTTDLDPCRVALPLRITHGRSGVSTQPDAPVCAFTYLGSTPPGAVGDSLEVLRPSSSLPTPTWGDPVAAWSDPIVTWTGREYDAHRFAGSITSITAAESGGQVEQWLVTATGASADLGRTPVLLVRPVETDAARVQAIAAAAGVPVTVVGTTDLLLAADTIDMDALSALHQVCTSAAGLLWQRPDGGLMYGTAGHRATPATTRIACDYILDGIDWTNDVEDIINSVTVRWGEEAASNSVNSVWNYRTGTGDPGTGNVHISAGLLRFSRIDKSGFDMAPVLRALPNGTTIYGQEKANADRWARWAVTGAVTDSGTYFSVPVTELESSDSGYPGLNADLAFRFNASSEQQATHTDTDSIAQWGVRHVDVNTLLFSATQAAQLGLLILARRADPWWRMPGVMLWLDRVPDETMEGFERTLDVSAGVVIPVESAPSPTPGDITEWTVEGWVEQWGEDGHQMQLAVSERARTGDTGLRSWQQVAAGTWASWAAGTWMEQLVQEAT